MCVRRFATKDEFQTYLTEKYGKETGEKIYSSIDAYDGVVTHTFWVYTPENGYAFSESRADLCVNKIWK